MADLTRCDFCKAIGWRKLGKLAPEGWFYLEATDDTNPNNCLIIWACSKECADKQWLAGPGRLDLTQSTG